MADQADEVLELDEEQVIDPEGDEPEEQDTEEQDEANAEDEDRETYPSFGDDDDGDAPSPESESSVIRELRGRIRELTAEKKALETRVRELTAEKKALETRKQPEQIEVGNKPSLESCEYDEERYETELDAWKDRKVKAERADAKRTEEREKQAAVWSKAQQTYEADKASLALPNFDEAEAEVAAVLPEEHRALLLKSGKGAALVAALHRSPTTLEELSKLDPADAAMMIGELRSKLQMKTRSRPNPDRPVKGNAASTNADKELARLEKEADRTGDRTELINYKRKLKSKA